MFKNLTVRARLFSLIAFLSVLLAIIGFIGLRGMSQANDGLRTVYLDRTVPIGQLAELSDLTAENIRQLHLASMHDPRLPESKLHDHPITKHTDIVEQNIAEITKIWDVYAAHSMTSEEKTLADSYLTARKEFVKEGLLVAMGLYKQGLFAEGNEKMVKVVGPMGVKTKGLADELKKLQIRIAKEEFEKSVTAYDRIRTIAIAAILLGIAFAVFIGVMIVRNLMKQLGGEPDYAAETVHKIADGDLSVDVMLKAGDTGSMLFAIKNMVAKLSEIITAVRSNADSLASASEQISATAQSLSQASSEQAASVEETSASIEQMTASINQNTENAKITDSMASKASREAIEGGQAVGSTVEAMKKIAGKIGIVDDIAYQTNLLALNAAIEAARAGEHGKGFAVVAAEVRKLAERSQVAAQEIGELASSSVSLAEKAGKLLDEMVPSINKTSDLVQEIASASSEQSSGVAQINGAMGQLNQTTQQNASASEELAATFEEMSSQTEQLQSVMTFFKLGDAGAQGITSVRHSPGPSRSPAPKLSKAAFKTPVGKTTAAAPLDADPHIFTAAVEAHTHWKTKLRMCTTDHSKCPDPAAAEKDDACELGKWIYGDGQRFAADNEFQQLSQDHASFHRCAARIIRSVQQGQTREAENLLAGEYAKISTKVISMLTHLKSRCKTAQNFDRF